MIRRPPRSTRVRSSAASDVYKRQRWRKPVGRSPVQTNHTRPSGNMGVSTEQYEGEPVPERTQAKPVVKRAAHGVLPECCEATAQSAGVRAPVWLAAN